MINKQFVKLILILTLATLACRLASPASDSPLPAPVQSTVSVPTVSLPSLKVEQLKNAQYQLGTTDSRNVVQLTDGKYQHGTDNTTLDYAQITLTDFVSIGDLNADGINEAAAMVFENYGGTGSFGFLAIYTNVNGLPVFLTSIIIDDRPMINGIKIENGQVYLDATIHGAQDPGCCPALPTTRRYTLANNQLRLTHYTTAAPNGTIRSIEVLSPTNGTESTQSIQVNGTISIAPFENNLTYMIYDEAGNQLAQGPIAVVAPDFGAAGTFNETVSLTGIPTGTTIYFELQDISAADGSWLAMDAVKLFVK